MAAAHRLAVRSGLGPQSQLKYSEVKPNALRIPFLSSVRLGQSKHIAVNAKAAVLARAATSTDVAVSSPSYVDQEDFAKAGGSELDFALLQAAKEMDDQAKISNTLPPVDKDAGIVDVAVIGCGPAGLSISAELARQGVSVALIGRDQPFVNNYGVWVDEFKAIGLDHCLDHVWRDTVLYMGSDTPITTGRPYGRADRRLLRDELLARCLRGGVRYQEAVADRVDDEDKTGSTVVCTNGETIRARLVVAAAGAASGKFISYRDDTKGVGAQTAYGVEVELDSPYPYPPDSMLFMDFRDLPPTLAPDEAEDPEQWAQLPTFVYAMPLSPTRVFFEETCLAARPGMPFSVLKERLKKRLRKLGIKYSALHEEEWSYIPVGGSLPFTNQRHLGFGAAASMIHPATGYSITRSLTEAPAFARAIAAALNTPGITSADAASQAWLSLWSPERQRQRAFMIFGLELILQLDVHATRDFFDTFFRLPPRLWQGFLASDLSSMDLLVFALTTFALAPTSLRIRLVAHLFQDHSGANLVRAYAGLPTTPPEK